MIPKLSETNWERELTTLQFSKLTAEKLLAAIQAFIYKRKAPVVTRNEFYQITKEIFFFELGEKRLLLNRDTVGTLTLVEEEKPSRVRYDILGSTFN